MRNRPLPGLCKKSPLRTDTKLADRVYRRDKVDATLRERGEHTEGSLRGTKNTSTGDLNAGINNAMIDPTA